MTFDLMDDSEQTVNHPSTCSERFYIMQNLLKAPITLSVVLQDVCSSFY